MLTYLKLFKNHSEYEEYLQSGDMVLPNVSYCTNIEDVHYNPYMHDYSTDYLTFVALEDGTFKFSKPLIQYSIDNGETWNSLSANTNTPTVAAGDKILWKSTNLTAESGGIGTFSSTGMYNVQGNAMSLHYGDNFSDKYSVPSYGFMNLFSGNAKLINAKNLVLPATTLANRCYYGVFQNCTALVNAPKLPAVNLETHCYANMFRYCSSLVSAPDLPATTLATNCYMQMFQNCSSLNYVKCLSTNGDSGFCGSWLASVKSNGTFIKASGAVWASGQSGIPDGWPVIEE